MFILLLQSFNKDFLHFHSYVSDWHVPPQKGNLEKNLQKLKRK